MTKFHFLLIATVAVIAGVVILYALREQSVLYSPGGGVRDTESRMVLNPFRDRRPETVAARVLERMRQGQCAAIMDELTTAQDLQEATCKSEASFPLKAWKLAAREDETDSVKLRFDILRESPRGVQTDPFWVVLDRTPTMFRVHSIETQY